jgi:1-acyl-sn-glycerol-3-phosphate acyltransferase
MLYNGPETLSRKKHDPTLLQRACRGFLGMIGWTLDDDLPELDKYVIIAAPHTSNWDFVLGMIGMEAIGLPRTWVGKASLFRWPTGWLMRALGGMPVDRSSSHNFVDQVVEIFDGRDELVLTVAPEGTRSRTDHWKTGFYYIALGAKVPIVLGYIDWSRKIGGIGPTLVPTGDIEADFEAIRAFYADKRGLYPDEESEIGLRNGESKGGSE